MNMEMKKPGIYDILLVEDNPGYVYLIAEAIKEEKLPANLSVVMDGAEALSFLYREDKYARAPRPDLILLDLKLPKKNGQSVLAEIKNDPALKRIPVVILTVSGAEQDIQMSYDLHANCYIIKPVDLDQFIAAMKSIVDFWLTIVTPPPD